MGFKKIEQRLTAAYKWYGELVGGHPCPFLIVPLLLTLLVGPGLFVLKYDDDAMMLFTPYNAPSRREQQISRQFAHTAVRDRNSTTLNGKMSLPLSSDDDPYTDTWFNLQVTSVDNLMTSRSWEVISNVVNGIYENFTCHVNNWVDKVTPAVARSGPPYTLSYKKDFCNPDRGCLQLNTVVDKVRDLMNETKYGNNSKVQLTYPVMYVWGRPFNWGEYIFGVRVDNDTGKLLTAKMLNLYLAFQVGSDPISRAAGESCIRQLTKYTLNLNKENEEVMQANLSFYPINEPLLADEVSRIQGFSLPYLIAVVVVIIIFIAITSFKRRFAVWSLIGACMGVLTVGLSLLASYGLLCICGVHMNFVVAITPFLVLCVGIDNDFLVTSAWRQTADGHSSIKRRMGRAFADCGPSLTITSINDILCFGVGYLSETPAVADFCMHTCVALLFRFLFQLTFFAAIVVYIGRREMAIDEKAMGVEGKKAFRFPFFQHTLIGTAEELPKKLSSTSATSDFNTNTTVIELGSVMVTAVPPLSMVGAQREHQRIHTFFGETYSTFLMMKSVRFVTCILYVVYIVAAVYGAATWIIEITPQKLFFDDSVLQHSLGNGEAYLKPETIIGRVYVTSPPDFRYKAQVDRFLQFVEDLEDLDGANSSRFTLRNKEDLTDIWIREYNDFFENLHPSDESEDEYRADFYDYLPDFLESSDYSRFVGDLRFKRENATSEIKLDRFQFVVSYFRSPENRFVYENSITMLLNWRAVCSNYSEYGAVVFDQFQMNAYYDQRLTLAPTCLQTMGIALCAMSVVTALLMPHVRSMFFICLSFLSVDVGVIAGLNMWGSDLDPTSMAFVLMTIGFSVYYTARVCYCYQSAGCSLTSEEKIRRTMETVGWPILQGAVATLVGVVPIMLIPSYMMRVFYRTVILIVLIGLAHGLLIIPICMSAFDLAHSPIGSLRRRAERRARRKKISDGQTPDTLSEYSTS